MLKRKTGKACGNELLKLVIRKVQGECNSAHPIFVMKGKLRPCKQIDRIVRLVTGLSYGCMRTNHMCFLLHVCVCVCVCRRATYQLQCVTGVLRTAA